MLVKGRYICLQWNVNRRFAHRPQQIDRISRKHGVRVEPDKEIEAEPAHANLEVMQLEEAMGLFQLIGVVAFAAIERTIAQDVKFLEHAGLPRRANTMLHHGVVSAVANR